MRRPSPGSSPGTFKPEFIPSPDALRAFAGRLRRLLDEAREFAVNSDIPWKFSDAVGARKPRRAIAYLGLHTIIGGALPRRLLRAFAKVLVFSPDGTLHLASSPFEYAKTLCSRS
jgi:hypothetical protein